MNYIPKNRCNCNNAAKRELVNQPVPGNMPTLFQSHSLEWVLTLFFLSQTFNKWWAFWRTKSHTFGRFYSWFGCFSPLSGLFHLEYGLRERFLHPCFPNISAATDLALSKNWHLPDIWNHLHAVQGTDKVVFLKWALRRGLPSSKTMVCIKREMGCWRWGAGMPRLVETGGPWPPWVLSCQYVFLEGHSYFCSLRPWDPHKTKW